MDANHPEEHPQPPPASELGVLRRPLKPFEFAPPHYFKRLQKEQLLSDPSRPLEIDLGCGDGDFLIELAKAYPEREFLGVERLLGRVDKVGRKIRRHQLENCRILRLEIDYTVRWLLPLASVSRLHILCPDPWPKKRHHKNRLMQADFFEALAQVLEVKGELLFMTDDLDYYQWTVAIFEDLPAEQAANWQRLPWEAGDFFYPKTGFQRQWEDQGKSMHYLRLGLSI